MIRKLSLVGALSASLLMLGGCDPSDSQPAVGGGGGGGGGGGAVMLSGTAAVGAVLAAATVEIRGITSAPLVNGTTDANGDYSIDVSSLTPPLVIVVTGGTYDPDGAGPLPTLTNSTPLYSTSYTGTGTANVTSLTTLALQNAANATDLLGFYNNWATTRPTLADVQAAAARVRANLAAQLTSAGVPATYDFFSAAFPAVGAGIDAVMDAVTCTPTGTGGTFTVSCTNGSTPLPFNLTISTTGFTGGGSGGTGGTLTVPPTSTWSLTVNGAPAGSVPGSQVPSTAPLLEAYGRNYATLNGAYSGPGFTVTFSGLTFGFSNSGDGSTVGDTITGTQSGNISIVGTLPPIPPLTTGIPINVSNAINYTFVWTRTM